MRKYRILEEKYEYGSHFYPQYKDENTACYVLGYDERGNAVKSDYQYFSSWKENSSGVSYLKKTVFHDISMARHRIEMDIQEHKVGEPKEIIIHEY